MATWFMESFNFPKSWWKSSKIIAKNKTKIKSRKKTKIFAWEILKWIIDGFPKESFEAHSERNAGENHKDIEAKTPNEMNFNKIIEEIP